MVLWMRFSVLMCGTVLAGGLCWASVNMASSEKTMAPHVWGWFLGAGVGLFLSTMGGVIACIKAEDAVEYEAPENDRPNDAERQDGQGSNGGDADQR